MDSKILGKAKETFLPPQTVGIIEPERAEVFNLVQEEAQRRFDQQQAQAIRPELLSTFDKAAEQTLQVAAGDIGLDQQLTPTPAQSEAEPDVELLGEAVLTDARRQLVDSLRRTVFDNRRILPLIDELAQTDDVLSNREKQVALRQLRDVVEQAIRGERKETAGFVKTDPLARDFVTEEVINGLESNIGTVPADPNTDYDRFLIMQAENIVSNRFGAETLPTTLNDRYRGYNGIKTADRDWILMQAVLNNEMLGRYVNGNDTVVGLNAYGRKTVMRSERGKSLTPETQDGLTELSRAIVLTLDETTPEELKNRLYQREIEVSLVSSGYRSGLIIGVEASTQIAGTTTSINRLRDRTFGQRGLNRESFHAHADPKTKEKVNRAIDDSFYAGYILGLANDTADNDLDRLTSMWQASQLLSNGKTRELLLQQLVDNSMQYSQDTRLLIASITGQTDFLEDSEVEERLSEGLVDRIKSHQKELYLASIEQQAYINGSMVLARDNETIASLFANHNTSSLYALERRRQLLAEKVSVAELHTRTIQKVMEYEERRHATLFAKYKRELDATILPFDEKMRILAAMSDSPEADLVSRFAKYRDVDQGILANQIRLATDLHKELNPNDFMKRFVDADNRRKGELNPAPTKAEYSDFEEIFRPNQEGVDIRSLTALEIEKATPSGRKRALAIAYYITRMVNGDLGGHFNYPDGPRDNLLRLLNPAEKSYEPTLTPEDLVEIHTITLMQVEASNAAYSQGENRTPPIKFVSLLDGFIQDFETVRNRGRNETPTYQIGIPNRTVENPINKLALSREGWADRTNQTRYVGTEAEYYIGGRTTGNPGYYIIPGDYNPLERIRIQKMIKDEADRLLEVISTAGAGYERLSLMQAKGELIGSSLIDWKIKRALETPPSMAASRLYAAGGWDREFKGLPTPEEVATVEAALSQGEKGFGTTLANKGTLWRNLETATSVAALYSRLNGELAEIADVEARSTGLRKRVAMGLKAYRGVNTAEEEPALQLQNQIRRAFAPSIFGPDEQLNDLLPTLDLRIETDRDKLRKALAQFVYRQSSPLINEANQLSLKLAGLDQLPNIIIENAFSREEDGVVLVHQPSAIDAKSGVMNATNRGAIVAKRTRANAAEMGTLKLSGDRGVDSADRLLGEVSAPVHIGRKVRDQINAAVIALEKHKLDYPILAEMGILQRVEQNLRTLEANLPDDIMRTKVGVDKPAIETLAPNLSQRVEALRAVQLRRTKERLLLNKEIIPEPLIPYLNIPTQAEPAIVR